MSTTETLRPTSDSAKALGVLVGPANYQDVDEDSKDDLTTYVFRNNAAYAEDVYGFGDHTGTGIVISVQICAYSYGYVAYADNRYKPLVKVGGTVYYGDEFDSADNDTFQLHSHTWSVNPDTGNGWTWAEIDALLAGIALKGTNSLTTQVYAVVTYEPFTPRVMIF